MLQADLAYVLVDIPVTLIEYPGNIKLERIFLDDSSKYSPSPWCGNEGDSEKTIIMQEHKFLHFTQSRISNQVSKPPIEGVSSSINTIKIIGRLKSPAPKCFYISQANNWHSHTLQLILELSLRLLSVYFIAAKCEAVYMNKEIPVLWFLYVFEILWLNDMTFHTWL